MESERIYPNDSEDEDASAMEAFMGFSAFGSHKPTKKRKFNPSTDAFVEGQKLEKLDRGGKKGMGSGGNTMPMGKVRVMGEAMGRGGNDEIELDLDEEEDREGAGPRYIDTSLPPPAGAELRGGNGGEIEDEDGPRYMDTSLPAPADVVKERDENDEPAYVGTSEPSSAEAAEIQARIDSILARIAPDNEAAENDADAQLADATAESSMLPPPLGLPQRPAITAASDTDFMQGGSRGSAFSNAASNNSRSGRGRRRGGGGRERGERNEKWYEGYYDPTFNENPWARLEKEKGLPSVGTWLENLRKRDDGPGAGVS